MQAAKSLARVWGLSEELTNDVVSIAWELSQSGRGTANAIAWFALRRVRSRRRFRESVRSIDSPMRSDLKRSEADVVELDQPGADPAQIAIISIFATHSFRPSL
jgi:hypothetical protein